MKNTKHIIGQSVTHDAAASIPMRRDYDVSAGVVTIPFDKLMLVTNIAISSQLLRVERFKDAVRDVTSPIEGVGGSRLSEVDINNFGHATQNLTEALRLRNHLILVQERENLQLVHIPVVEEDSKSRSVTSPQLYHI